MRRVLTAYVEKDLETGLYVAVIPGLPGGHTQAASLDELRDNLQEVTSLILEEPAERGEEPEMGEFVGIQQIEVPN
jgi:predicted RNase H-like HicB family nuclease